MTAAGRLKRNRSRIDGQLQAGRPFGGDVAEQQADAGGAELDATDTRQPLPCPISAVLSTLLHGKFRAAGFLQCRQIGLRQLPQDGGGNTLVVMAQYVAYSRDFLPGDFRIARFQVIRKVATGFGNNLNATLNEPLPLPIVFERCQRHIRQYAVDAFDRLDNIR